MPQKPLPLQPGDWEALDEYLSATSPVFNVQDRRFVGGAKGDGVTDDTAAIQACINAAIATGSVVGTGATVVFPPPTKSYRITNTLQIVPQSTLVTQVYVNLAGPPSAGAATDQSCLFWDGPNSTPVISSRGWRYSSIYNVSVSVRGTKTGTVVWDIDNTGTLGGGALELPPYTISSTLLDFHNCSVFFTTGSTSGYGWRVGASGRPTDLSAMSWHDCSVYGAGAGTANHTGWSFEIANAIGFHWFGGLSFYCNPMIRVATGEGFSVFGMDGTHNDLDYSIGNNASLKIVGGRYEFGKRFMSITHNTNQPQPIVVSGTKLYNYGPGDGQLFNCQGLPILELDNMMVVNVGGSDYTNQAIILFCTSAGIGKLLVEGGVWQAAYPFWSANLGGSGTFDVECKSVTRATNASVFSSVLGRNQSNVLAYSGTIATDANLSDYFTIAATNGTAFTISTPTNPFSGRSITYDIKNSSGGAMGAITWGAGFLNGGAGTVGTGAFAGIANGKRRTISFKYDGTNWIELFRTADI